MHLDERTHAALLQGILSPPDAHELSAHLRAGCDLCEAFLARRARADGADGRVDRALAALATGAGAGVASGSSEAEFRRIEAGLARAAGPGRAGASRRGFRPLAAAAAILAVAGVAALVARTPGRAGPEPAWDGVKGEAGAVPVHLRFAVVTGAGDATGIRPGASGEVVPAAGGLRFEVDLGRAAHVAVVRLGPGSAEAVWEADAGPGSTPVTLGDRPAVYRLEGLGGPQRFVAVASDAPLPPEALARAAAAGGPGTSAVEVRVE
jgi:hypothetical protein